MWTFLGIATFTYIYKKSNMLLNVAHKELLLIAALFLSAGLLISYIRFVHGHKLSLSQIVYLPLSVLSALPLVKHFIPQTGAESSKKAEKKNTEKVSQQRCFTFCLLVQSGWVLFLLL